MILGGSKRLRVDINNMDLKIIIKNKDNKSISKEDLEAMLNKISSTADIVNIFSTPRVKVDEFDLRDNPGIYTYLHIINLPDVNKVYNGLSKNGWSLIDSQVNPESAKQDYNTKQNDN